MTESEKFFGSTDSKPETAQPITVDQPSKFPTPKVAAFGGVSLVLYQFFDVLREVWTINIVPSARELIATVVGGAAAWFTKEFKERRKV